MTINNFIKTAAKQRLGSLSNLFPFSHAKAKPCVSFDYAAVKKLSKIMGDAFPDLMDKYFSVMSELTINLELAIAHKNYKDIAHLAHTTRSPSSQVGAIKIVEIASEIEDIARNNGSLSDIAVKFTVLRELITQANSELRHYIASKAMLR